ncbi:MAG: signal peptidase I [Ruminococcus sp.]|nr:signal peptidase I [Ruminococcus sp.]
MGKRRKRKNPALDAFLDWCETIVLAVFVVILMFTFVFRIAHVYGISMQSTLYEGDVLIISHLFYEPERGDIIVVNSSVLDETIIKRVIATEGETVSIDCKDASVYVNGEKTDEPYISMSSFDTGAFNMNDYLASVDRYEYTVPKGCVFVLGDNRNHSTDSREIGFISNDEIVGRVLFRAVSEQLGTGKVE